MKTVLDVDSPELRASRNSRYEVVDLILSDLDKAIEYLPSEQNIPSEDKGRISKGGAEALRQECYCMKLPGVNIMEQALILKVLQVRNLIRSMHFWKRLLRCVMR